MKAAISIPDDVFWEGERLACRLKTSRSHLYAMALTQFVAQHDDNKITAAMNDVVAQVGTGVESFSKDAEILAKGPYD